MEVASDPGNQAVGLVPLQCEQGDKAFVKKKKTKKSFACLPMPPDVVGGSSSLVDV